MNIIRKRLKEGAAEASGLAVIIDVFRAFTCQPLFFYYGAERVILETDPGKAREMKQQNGAYILVGEVDEVPMEGADLGNSPSEIIKRGEDFFRGRTVIHRSTAGVTGVAAAHEAADEVVMGSFVMAGAVARYVREKDPDTVCLVGMGDRANKPAPEDEACADYIEHLLTGKLYDPIRTLHDIVYQVTAQKFIVGGKSYLPREDPIFCLQRDLFDFVLTVEKVGETLQVFQQTVHPPVGEPDRENEPTAAAPGGEPGQERVPAEVEADKGEETGPPGAQEAAGAGAEPGESAGNRQEGAEPDPEPREGTPGPKERESTQKKKTPKKKQGKKGKKDAGESSTAS